MKIGILGGTFNPIHNAHLQMARIALDALSLDRVLFMVANDPPHKVVDDHVSAEHRYAMTALAVQDADRLEASDLELRRDGKSYTADTLQSLHDLYPGASFTLIIGSDMLANFPTWYHPERVAALSEIACITRHGQESHDAENAASIRKTFSARIHMLYGDADELSSTAIRERFDEALPVSHMLPKAVERYCYEQGLYFPADVQRMQRQLQSCINTKRYIHTMGVVRTAIEYAALWQIDGKKARIAALLHDCAKCLPIVTLAVLSGDDTGIASVMHAFAGAVVAHNEYGITDQEILRAIRLHSTGDAEMTPLDQLLYLSDMIEPNRDYPAVAELRQNMRLGADEAMFQALLQVKRHVMELCSDGEESAFHPAGDRAIQYFETIHLGERKEK